MEFINYSIAVSFIILAVILCHWVTRSIASAWAASAKPNKVQSVAPVADSQIETETSLFASDFPDGHQNQSPLELEPVAPVELFNPTIKKSTPVAPVLVEPEQPVKQTESYGHQTHSGLELEPVKQTESYGHQTHSGLELEPVKQTEPVAPAPVEPEPEPVRYMASSMGKPTVHDRRRQATKAGIRNAARMNSATLSKYGF